ALDGRGAERGLGDVVVEVIAVRGRPRPGVEELCRSRVGVDERDVAPVADGRQPFRAVGRERGENLAGAWIEDGGVVVEGDDEAGVGFGHFFACRIRWSGLLPGGAVTSGLRVVGGGGGGV